MNATPNGYFEYQDAIEVSDLSPQERLVALTYASSYNWKNENDSSCGIYRIAAKTGLKKTQVSTYRSSLIEKGWLESVRRFGTSSLTKPTVPAGFSYEDEKAKQDELVESQNAAEKARRNKPSKKDAEIEALKAELETLKKAQSAPVEPVAVPPVQEDPEPVTEPQKAAEEPYETSTNLSWGDEKTDEEILAEDVFEESSPIAPVVEKKIEAPKPARKTRKKAEKVDPVKQMLEQARHKKSFDDDFVESRIAESDNPVEAQRLYDSEEFQAKYPDKVQRAAQAAFEVMGSLANA